MAHHLGVPVVLMTGDDSTVDDAKHWIPEARGIAVKRSIGRFAADSMTPTASRKAIAAATRDVLAKPLPAINPALNHAELELTFQSAEMASLAEWVGASRTGHRTVLLTGETGLDLYRKFHLVLIVARSVVDS